MTFRDIIIEPVVPVLAVATIAVALTMLTWFAYRQVGSRLGVWRNAFLMLVRVAGIVLVCALLLQPSVQEPVPTPQGKQVLLVGVDTSRSMLQADVQKQMRFEAARQTLFDAGLITREGQPKDAETRLFEFGEDATPVSASASFINVLPKAPTTRLHRSVVTMLNSPGAAESAQALVLLTDGHDFELVNPAKTALAAKSRQTPIYAVAFGGSGKAKDVSVRITNYQPYCYVKQKARISASLRLIGCEHEPLTIHLLRQGKVVQTRRLNTDEHSQLPVEFEVTEPGTGQFEYEVQAVALAGEADAGNNSAITFLNVIDQQIRVLVLEGAPYWDTTFLQRSLQRNDKVQLDSAVQYADRRIRLIRNKATTDDLNIPATAEEFNRYDLVILGRSVDTLLQRRHLDALQSYVNELGGAVIFSRGRAFSGELAKNDLEPVLWDDRPTEQVRLQIGNEGRALAPFRSLAEQSGGTDAMPELIAGRGVAEKKPLTAVLASAKGPASNEVTPAMVHRRFGRGQVLSVGVDGLWRWAFNAKTEGANTTFDRFWDQMLLWLMAGRDVLPSRQFSLRASSGNVQLGEKVFFRLIMRTPDAKVREVPIALFDDKREVARTSLAISDPSEPYRLTAEFTPEKTGKFRALARFPDGTSEEARFIVFNDNPEETEVAADVTYLKRLCSQSGGRLLDPNELTRLVQDLRLGKLDSAPKTRIKSVWDGPLLFYLIGLLFATDWFLRRRWGLC